MRNVEAFIDDVVTDMRRRLVLLGAAPRGQEDGDRRAVEDGIALLTDYRLTGMDEALFERLLATLRSGRSPVRLAVLKPETIAGELARRWSAFTERTAPALSVGATN